MEPSAPPQPESDIRYELLEPTVPGLVARRRRRFIIVVSFDICLCFLLWALFVATKTTNWKEEFICQINLANRDFFFRSIFDLVIVSCFRFHILTICYACVRMKHWIAVALTTGCSTVFTIVKAVLYFGKRHNGLPLEFALVTCSLVLCFIEVFLYDSRFGDPPKRDVESAETTTREAGSRREDYITAYDNSSTNSDDAETSTAAHPMLKYIGNVDSSECTKRALYAMRFKEIWVNELSTWKKVSSIPFLLSTQSEEFGKVFYLRHEFPVSVQHLFNILYIRTDDCPQWHKDIILYKVLSTYGNVDLTYSVSAPSMRGYVASREFFDVRMLQNDEPGVYTISSVSFDVSVPPQNPNLIRGENGPNIVIFTSLDTDRCQMEWFFNTNLKGNLPRTLIDRSLVQFLTNFVRNLEAHLSLL